VLLNLLKRHLFRIAISLVVLAFFLLHVGGQFHWGFIDRIENIAFDTRLRLTMPNTTDDRIVIVDIDEKSLAAEGRWPWGRDKLARLVDQLFERYRVGLLGFDVVFAEPDDSGLRILERLEGAGLAEDPGLRERLGELRPRLDNDRIFARSLEGRPVVLGYFFSAVGEVGEAPQVGALPPPLFEEEDFEGRKIDFLEARGYGANLRELQEAARTAGHFTPYVDADGVVRRVPLLYGYEGGYYAALSLAVSRLALGGPPPRPGFPEEADDESGYTGIEWLDLGERRIPVDNSVRVLVPYRGPQGSFPYVSATDVLSGEVPPERLEGRIVLVGTSAAGLQDLRSTPVQPAYPGVEIHANLISGLLDNDIMDNPEYTRGAEFVLLLASGIVMAFVLPMLSPLWSALTTFALLAGIVGTNLYLWEYQNMVFPLSAGVLAVLALFLVNMTYGFFIEARGKRQLTGLFGQYVPPELVDEMSKSPEAYSLEGESREMTVLFSDVRSFTTISEGLNPRELSQLMNEFLTPMTHIIHDYRGTIDKYMGDAIMAFWGAPLADPDHARHALQAALDMIARLEELQPEFHSRGWPDIRIGVGLNTGLMNVGNMGSEFRMAYTVLGDAVNLGSRLEGLTKQYGVQIITSESTKNAVPDYVYRELDRVRVKGKDKPVTIYEPIGPKESVPKSVRDELKLLDQALKLYRAQEWDMAEIQLLNLQKSSPDRLIYQEYLKRIQVFREDPPGADWDGVFTHATK